MPTQKLTNKSVENAKPPSNGRLLIWDSVIGDDTTLPGSFGLRITERGVKSWVTMYRVDAAENGSGKKQRFMTLGHYPATSLAQARENAREALKAAGRGIDPVDDKKAQQSKAASIKTVGAAVEAFIERHAKRHNRTWKGVERAFRVYVLPKWATRPLRSITPADVHDILDALIDAGYPYMANRMLAHIRKFFNWCKERHWIDHAPTEAIKPPAKEEARDRVLETDEIRRFWQACGGLGWPFGPAFKLLLTTGQRRDEVARMKWEHVDLAKQLWTLPKQVTKSDRLHQVPLSMMALELITALPRNGEFVFSTNGKTPISGFSKAKKRLDQLSGLNGWRLHDLRRTAASGMAEIGIAPHVIEKVLNHSTGQISGVAAIYNRHAYITEKQDALNAWTSALEAITRTGEVADNVVKLGDVS